MAPLVLVYAIIAILDQRGSRYQRAGVIPQTFAAPSSENARPLYSMFVLGVSGSGPRLRVTRKCVHHDVHLLVCDLGYITQDDTLCKLYISRCL